MTELSTDEMPSVFVSVGPLENVTFNLPTPEGVQTILTAVNALMTACTDGTKPSVGDLFPAMKTYGIAELADDFCLRSKEQEDLEQFQKAKSVISRLQGVLECFILKSNTTNKIVERMVPDRALTATDDLLVTTTIDRHLESIKNHEGLKGWKDCRSPLTTVASLFRELHNTDAMWKAAIRNNPRAWLLLTEWQHGGGKVPAREILNGFEQWVLVQHPDSHLRIQIEHIGHRTPEHGLDDAYVIEHYQILFKALTIYADRVESIVTTRDFPFKRLPTFENPIQFPNLRNLEFGPANADQLDEMFAVWKTPNLDTLCFDGILFESLLPPPTYPVLKSLDITTAIRNEEEFVKFHAFVSAHPALTYLAFAVEVEPLDITHLQLPLITMPHLQTLNIKLQLARIPDEDDNNDVGDVYVISINTLFGASRRHQEDNATRAFQWASVLKTLVRSIDAPSVQQVRLTLCNGFYCPGQDLPAVHDRFLELIADEDHFLFNESILRSCSTFHIVLPPCRVHTDTLDHVLDEYLRRFTNADDVHIRNVTDLYTSTYRTLMNKKFVHLTKCFTRNHIKFQEGFQDILDPAEKYRIQKLFLETDGEDSFECWSMFDLTNADTVVVGTVNVQAKDNVFWNDGNESGEH